MAFKLSTFFISLTTIPTFAIANNDYAGDIIISAAKIEQPSDKVGSSVTILKRETLLKQGDRTIADSLSRVTGVSLTRSGGVGSVANIRIRGVDQSQVLVLIDGARVSDTASVNRAFDFGTFMVTDIERIEILRGNQSALYGSDAIGGVINIITFKPEQGVIGNAFAEGGSFGTIHSGASVRGGSNNLSYGLSVNHFKNDGFSRRNTGKERDGNEITNLRGNLGIDFNDNLNLTFNGGYELANTQYDSGFSNSQEGDDDKELIYGGATLTHYAFDDVLKNQFFYRTSQTDRHSNFGSGFTGDFKGTHQKLGYQGDISLFEQDTLTVGADIDKESADTLRSNNNHSIFVNYLKAVGDDLTLTLGGRIDDHEQFGKQETFRSSIAYNIPITNSKFHASYGTGFRAPSLFQLFSSFSGNPNLNPEKSRGFDIGVTQNFWHDKITTDVTFFNTKIDNLVNFDNNTFRYFNTDKADINGFEVDLSADITDNLNIFSNYTFTISKDDTTNLTLARRPKHLLNIGSNININQYNFTLLGRYVGDQIDNNTSRLVNDSFFVVDAQTSYDLTDKVTLYGRIDNVFDTDYQEVLTYNTPGVSAYGGLRFKF